MAMKRKAEEHANGTSKKQAISTSNVHANFHDGLFPPTTTASYTSDYASSAPYLHTVVQPLVDDALLRNVRQEIVDNIHFTPKETDIYKIHQSGDLANLSGLDESALEKLPSLLKLRDTLYSAEFRQWLSGVTGAGALSGQKTDMAVNVYVPGCHLLCHDDVIGSRRVSYILYLTDPDTPWQARWGGALRLYPTDEQKDEDGKTFKVPRAEWNKSIPPAWNQLSFFAVQPGESFHDVEEVYKRAEADNAKDGGRVRMAISGWFHIPQEGEDGYEPGLEEKLAEKSSLQQLQGNAEQFDEPQPLWHDPAAAEKAAEKGNGKARQVSEEEEEELTEEDLHFLLNYMTPNYLTPDTVEELNDLFTEESTLQLSNFLNKKLAARLRSHVEANNFTSNTLKTSKPPHKHRYQYLQPSLPSVTRVAHDTEPVDDLLNNFLPSRAFRKWLSLATGLTLKKCTVLARRFRRGLDYQLAQGYEGENPQLEYCLCVTPTPGWGADDEGEDGETEANDNGNNSTATKADKAEDDEDNVGGYELYMAGDDVDDDGSEAGSDHGVEIPASVQSQTGAGNRRSAKAKKADPAIYKAAAEDEDDGILFTNPASWNTLSVVLRDRGTLKFVKYVSQAAKGDRFDFSGAVEVEPDDEEDDEDEEGVDEDGENGEDSDPNDGDEEEFEGFEE